MGSKSAVGSLAARQEEPEPLSLPTSGSTSTAENSANPICACSDRASWWRGATGSTNRGRDVWRVALRYLSPVDDHGPVPRPSAGHVTTP
jgi:hypothetical protein